MTLSATEADYGQGFWSISRQQQQQLQQAKCILQMCG